MRIDQASPPSAAEADGALTLTFPTVPSGYSWIVSVIVPTAPIGAVAGVFLTGVRRLPILGNQPSSIIEAADGQTLSVEGTGFTPGARYRAFASGGLVQGPPPGVAPQGPATLTVATINAPVTVQSITDPVTVQSITDAITVDPIAATVGVFSGRVALAGTTTAVALIPATRTPTYWEAMRIGWVVWSTPSNTGTWIYIGDETGGTPTGWARIPSGKTKLMGSFSVAWGNAWVARVAGKLGDHVNVWAA